ncbi:HET-domain-containing protein [Xylariaceae sp. FL1272]|nr:HET-domain-containing protein [Xylariaceae sp. FL1272]
MTVCSTCNSFKLGQQGYGDQTPEASLDFINKHIPWPTFVQSAQGCYCCDILLRGICGCLRQQDLDGDQVESIGFKFRHFDKKRECCHRDFKCRMTDGTRVYIEMFKPTDHDCPCPASWEDVPTSLRTCARTDSEEAIEKAIEWIRTCNTDDHTRRQQRWPLPTRVVDVGRKDHVIRLVDGAGQLQPYLCLSHCWGTRLGLDYIWIDSLSIVQDDRTDWERESAGMGDIYHRAYLTLAATKSRSGTEGLFTSTPDFVVSGKTPVGEDYCLVFRPSIDHVAHFRFDPDRTAQYPLMTRAWALQERLLSLRVLHFGPRELWFKCSTTWYCQCGLMGTASKRISMDQIYISFANYTMLDLTFADDRLPALGGLARRFTEARGTHYLAGLQEDTLIDDLLWYAYGRLKPRLAGCGAPSWSWASVEAKADYSDAVMTLVNPEVYLANHTAYSYVNKCVCLPAGLDEYGRVKAGYLKMTGPLLPVDFLMKEDEYLLGFSDIELPTPCFHPDYYLEQEGPQQVLPGTKVYCLRILREASTNADVSLVLRAVTSTDKRLFGRIGLLQLMPHGRYMGDGLTAAARLLVPKALDKAVIETITII